MKWVGSAHMNHSLNPNNNHRYYGLLSSLPIKKKFWKNSDIWSIFIRFRKIFILYHFLFEFFILQRLKFCNMKNPYIKYLLLMTTIRLCSSSFLICEELFANKLKEKWWNFDYDVVSRKTETHSWFVDHPDPV